MIKSNPFHLPKKLPQGSEVDWEVVLNDSTETPIQRPNNIVKIILCKKYYLELNRRRIYIEHLFGTWKRFTILYSFYRIHQKRLG